MSNKIMTVLKGIHWFKDVLLPLVITILGIYLGLLLNQWQSNESERGLKQIIEKQIEEEVTENLKTVRITYDAHLQTQMLISRYDTLPDDSIPAFFDQWDGLKIAFLKRTAFESANTSGAFRTFHYQEYHQISTVYTYQGRLEDVYHMYSSSFLNLISTSELKSRKSISFLQIYLANVINNESNLISFYEKWLKQGSENK